MVSVLTAKASSSPSAEGHERTESPVVDLPGSSVSGSATTAIREEDRASRGAPPLETEHENPTGPTSSITSPAPADPPTLASRIAQLKASGFELQLRAGFTAGFREDSLNAASAFNQEQRFVVGAASDPIAQLDYRVGAEHELPPELRSTTKIEVIPFKLESNRTGDSSGTIVFRNHLDPAAPPFYETKVSLDQDGRIPSEERARLAKELLNRYREERATLQSQFEAALGTPSAPTAHAVSVDRTHTLTPGEQAQLGALHKQGFEIAATYVPDRGPIDRTIRADVLSKDYGFKMSPEVVSRLDGAKVNVAGDVPELVLRRDIQIDTVTRDPNSHDLLTANGRPATEIITDRHGNHVLRYVAPFRGDERGVEVFIIRPPIVASKELNPTPAPLEVDLTHFGVGEIPAVITRTPYRELSPIGSRTVVTNMAPDKIDPPVIEHLTQVGDGISRAEELFGAQPRSLGDRIAILNSDHPNAWFSPVNPSTVVIQDEILRSQIAPHTLGIHETAHLIDGGTSYKLSGGEFKATYERLRKAESPVIAALDECNFLPDTGIGGHGKDSHLELFASLTNSLEYAARNPKGWADRVATFTDDMRRDYRLVLEAFVKTLESVPAKPGQTPFGESPIARIARERIKALGG